MDLEAYYNAIGGDLPGVRSRLMSDERIIKFIGIFMEDPTFNDLVTTMAAGSWEEAFRAAHTMKGLCGNLGFDRLGAAASEITEALRVVDGAPADLARAQELLPAVEEAYRQIADGFQG